MNKIIFASFVFFCVYQHRLVAQLNFYSKPIETQSSDSIYLELNHKYFYSYFLQKYDSILVDFDASNLENILQRAAISKATNCGHLDYYLDNRIIYTYEVKNGKVNGVGVAFNNLLKGENGIPVRQAVFKDSKLSGVDVVCDYKTGIIYKIRFFKKGKMKKIIYPTP